MRRSGIAVWTALALCACGAQPETRPSEPRRSATTRDQVSDAVRALGGNGSWVRAPIDEATGVSLVSFDGPDHGRIVLTRPSGFSVFPFRGGCRDGRFEVLAGMSAENDRIPAARLTPVPARPPVILAACSGAVVAKGSPQAGVRLLRSYAPKEPPSSLVGDSDDRLSREAIERSKAFARRGRPDG